MNQLATTSFKFSRAKRETVEVKLDDVRAGGNNERIEILKSDHSVRNLTPGYFQSSNYSGGESSGQVAQSYVL